MIHTVTESHGPVKVTYYDNFLGKICLHALFARKYHLLGHNILLLRTTCIQKMFALQNSY